MADETTVVSLRANVPYRLGGAPTNLAADQEFTIQNQKPYGEPIAEQAYDGVVKIAIRSTIPVMTDDGHIIGRGETYWGKMPPAGALNIYVWSTEAAKLIVTEID